MERTLRTFAVAAFCLLSTIGCTTLYTTAPMQEKARGLANDLSVFRDAQSKKLDDLNASFDESAATSLDMLRSAKDEELRVDRETDAQKLADDLIHSRDASLRATFRASFAGQVKSQRDRIAEADQAIEDSRKKYAASYKQASLTLGKLDTTIDELRILGERGDKMQDMIKFTQSLYTVYRGLEAEHEQAKADAAREKASAAATAAANASQKSPAAAAAAGAAAAAAVTPTGAKPARAMHLLQLDRQATPQSQR
jgi:hypothetical protein